MPWQRHVADIALEVEPATGRLAYREVILTVPRQAGKSSCALAVAVHRALAFGSPQRILFTAQTRGDARKMWEDDHTPTLQRSPFGPLFTIRRQIGQESFRWANGSLHGLTAPNETAAHGQTLDLAVIDEAWAVGPEVEQGLGPAMITRPQPQQWTISTAGTPRSEWFRGKVDAGRAQPDGRPVAFFEWSADPDADAQDPATWWSCHPALGHTIAEDALRAELSRLDLDEFRRAYCNQWPDEMPHHGWTVITEDEWTALADPHSRIAGRPAFALDVSPDRQWCSIAAAGRNASGVLHVELVDHSTGTGWAVPRLAELVERHAPTAVVVDPGSAAGALLPALDAAGVETVKPTARDVAAAAGAFYDLTRPDSAGVRHLGQPALTAAVSGAVQRSLADAWTWSRRGSTVSITPLVACSLAAWGHASAPGVQLFVAAG